MRQIPKRFLALAAVLAMGVTGVAPALAGTRASGGQWLLGAHSSPPRGPGPGRLVAWKVGTATTRTAGFGKARTASGNSFYVAYDAACNTVFVPTVAGRTDAVDARTLKVKKRFASPPGSRVARVSPDHDLLLVLSGKETAAYALPGHKHLFTIHQGGNAVVFGPDGRSAYIGGNMNGAIVRIALPSGRVTRRYPVGHTGDLVRVDGRLFSVDMKSGVMSVIDLRSGHVQRLHTPEVDPHFSYHHVPAATAGFMQMAVDRAHHRLYVAGFSGHILKFATGKPAYLGEVAVRANSHGPNKLSGLALFDHGRRALTTVENLKAAVVVRLSNGKILRRLPGTASNRWIVVHRR